WVALVGARDERTGHRPASRRIFSAIMKIYRSINRVPGGMMVVPLFIGMLINTFFPDLLKIGGFTQALTGVGYRTILGRCLVTVGTKITLTTAPKILARGLGIMMAKVGTATIFALAVSKF